MQSARNWLFQTQFRPPSTGAHGADGPGRLSILPRGHSMNCFRLLRSCLLGRNRPGTDPTAPPPTPRSPRRRRPSKASICRPSTRPPIPAQIFISTPAATGLRATPFPATRCAGRVPSRFCKSATATCSGRSWTPRPASPTSALEKQYGNYFAACMNTDLVEQKGLKPLEPALQAHRRSQGYP